MLISNNIIDICKTFTLSVLDSNKNLYLKRNNSNIDKIKSDIFYGKISEFAFYEYIKTNYSFIEFIQPPDVNIYDQSSKSYDSDLKIKFNDKIYNIHIKSQLYNQSKLYGKSWMFQVKDDLTINPKDNDIIVFCINNGYKESIFLKIVLAKQILDYYKEPKLKHLKNIKKVIYYDDIKKIENFI